MNMKKLISMVLALVMMLAMSVTSFAQTVGTDAAGKGSITIENAAKGVTYKVIKLFDATVTDTVGGAIAYTGNIPEALKNVFEKTAAGNIIVKEGVTEEAVVEAVQAWAAAQTGTDVESDGSALTFAGLEYGYYAVVTSQGAVVTIASTNPDATVFDKNSTTPKNLAKSVDGVDYFIGDTIEYTVEFETANYNGSGETAQQIRSYTITDTLPEFLANVTVTSIKIGGVEYTVDGKVPQFDHNKQITIPWAVETDDGEWVSLYANGAKVEIEYTATLTEKAAIAGAGNTNTVTVTWDGGRLEDTETVYTYALALKKVNEKGEALAGATFQFPFYVKATTDADGAYIYAGTAEGEGLINTITTPTSGEIVIKGVEPGAYSVTETKAPDGYNMLTSAITVEAVKTSETKTETTTYLDKNGDITTTETTTKVEYKNDKFAATVKVVVNKAGAELPSTGAQGTKMLYIAGGILVAAAAVLLIVKRRMGDAE